MDDFLCEVQCDELIHVTFGNPTEQDWLDYQQWLDSQDDDLPQMLVDASESYKI